MKQATFLSWEIQTDASSLSCAEILRGHRVFHLPGALAALGFTRSQASELPKAPEGEIRSAPIFLYQPKEA